MSDPEQPPDGDTVDDSASWLVIDDTICEDSFETTVLQDLPYNVISPLNQIDKMRGNNRLGSITPTRRQTQAQKGKRKRKSVPTSKTPLVKKRKLTATPAKRKRNKNKKIPLKLIVIDSESESEPEISVIEIEDESTILEISDDEIGVCSGSLSTSSDKPILKPTQNIQNPPNVRQHPLPVVDTTGTFIPKMRNPPIVTTKATNAELYQPLADKNAQKTGLRPIVIDGCNVAFGHGRDRFSSLGLKICIDYFKTLGHEVRAFVPQFRKHHSATLDPQILDALEKDGTLSFTPSRRTDGKMIVSYDDRFIVQYADATGGVIVSRDNYRDLLNENPEWKDTVHNRLLMFTWVGDTIMFPKDPLGRGGPNLQDFLKY